MAPDESLSVHLPPEEAKALREAVAAGDYASPEEAARDAVHRWQQGRRDHAAWLDDVRARVRVSLDDPRPSMTAEEVDAHLEATFRSAGAIGCEDLTPTPRPEPPGQRTLDPVARSGPRGRGADEAKTSLSRRLN